MPVKFFISYSHEEYPFKDELVRRLHDLERKGMIEIWTDEQILPGQEWDLTIRTALLQAGIIVFLVSKKFIKSRYIHEVELKDAIERYNGKDAILIPIILEKIEPEVLDLFPLKKFEPLPVVNKKEVPVTEWTPQSGAYDNILIGIQKTLDALPPKRGPYADIVYSLRKLYKQARYDDIFSEMEKLGNFIKSRDMDLFNTYDTMVAQWKKVKIDEIRRAKGYEENSQHFKYQLIDFISLLENMIEKED